MFLLLCVFACGLSWTCYQNESLSSYLASLLLAVYAGGTSFFTFGMFGYHVYLTCIGMTTYEHVRPAPIVARYS